MLTQQMTETIKKLRELQQTLINDFTKGGIFDKHEGPLLKKQIVQLDNFFNDAQYAKSESELFELMKKHFKP